MLESIAHLIRVKDRSGYPRQMKERGMEMGRYLSVEIPVDLGRHNFLLSMTHQRQLTAE